MVAPINVTYAFRQAPTISYQWLNGVNDFTYKGSQFNDAAGGPSVLGYGDDMAYAAFSFGAVVRSNPISVHARPYSAVGDGVADDTAALQAAINACFANGGGWVILGRCKTYLCSSAIIMKAGVYVEMQGSRVNFALGGGAVYGFRMVTGSGLQGGKAYTISIGAVGAQYIFAAPISFGAPNNNGDSVASPDPFQTCRNTFVRNMELGNVRDYGPCIQIAGDVYNVLIENIYIPSSTTCSGIHADWGNVGVISSSAIGAAKTAFNAGLAYTTHPHNILVRNVNCGVLSKAAAADLGSHIGRLSACYGVVFENCRADSTTLAGFTHAGGDLGFEFALAAVKPHACKGNVFRNCNLGAQAATGTTNGVYIDTLADNVYREQFLTGYVTLMDPLMQGNVVVENCDFPGPNADGQYGVRIIQARGVSLVRNQLSKWKYGVWVDEFSRDVVIRDNAIFTNRETGVSVGFTLLREGTRDITIENNRIWGNGTISGGQGINLVRGKNVRVLDNIFGAADDVTQATAVSVTDSPDNYGIVLKGNHCESATTGAYILTSGTPVQPHYYRQISAAGDNTCNPRVPLFFGGMSYTPVLATEGTDNRPVRQWINPNSAAPIAGTWYRGDYLIQSAPTTGASSGHFCTISGTFGTLASITNGVTVSGTATVTASIATTVTSVAGNYDVTVASATGLRAGIKCSSAAAGITDATILSVSGTTLQLDVPAAVSQAGGAFTTPGVAEGEVLSINTTTPGSSLMVKKTVGNVITLSANLVDSQSGRTLSYTTPVFKAWANIA